MFEPSRRAFSGVSPTADMKTHKSPSMMPPSAYPAGMPSSAYPAGMPPSAYPASGPRNSAPWSPRRQKKGLFGKVRARFDKERAKYAQRSLGGKILTIVLLIAILLPTLTVLFETANAAIMFIQVESGISHLQAAANAFHNAPGNGAAKYFNLDSLHQAQGDVDAAHNDFAALSYTLDHGPAVGMFSSPLPMQIGTARSLGHIAVDATSIAQQFVSAAISVAPSVPKDTADQNSTSAPDIPAVALPALNNAFNSIKPLVHDMNMQAQGLSPNSLPISASQRRLLSSVMTLLPMLDSAVSQGNLGNAVGWLLGVDQQRTFLVEPMDSAELRATGGFTGQFGELTLNGGHMAPLSLKNIGQYEEDHTLEGSPPIQSVYQKVIGQSAPAPYVNWWPIGNFGVRDANASFDFPTSARMIMQTYMYEFGDNLDGVIIFTPNLIEQILQVTGPITIPQYHETITSQNLQDRLHYYQLNNAGIRQEELIENVNDPQQARKLFTQRVTSTLLKTAEHLPISQLLPMTEQMLQAMKTRDLQVYFSNPQLENLVAQYGSTASLDRSNDHDGLAIVQSNLSASKASQYVTTSIQDTVTLDTQGGATHQLQMTLDYQQKGDVFGFDTYRDYVRVYAPENSQFIDGNGFDQAGSPFCGDAQSGYALCPKDVYGDGSLVCPSGVTVGPATPYLNDPYAGADHPLDRTGAPTNLLSDEAGRAMFGGWVVVPKNCTMKVTLSWYVPPTGNAYSLLFQPQATVAPALNLSVVPAAGTCQGNTMNFSGVMNGQDTTFAVKQQGSSCSLQSSKV